MQIRLTFALLMVTTLGVLEMSEAARAGADAEPVVIWDGGPVPKAAEIPVLEGVEFHVIKPYEFDKDGYRFLHGVALAWHKGRLYGGNP